MGSDPSQSAPEETTKKKRRRKFAERVQKNWAPDERKLIQFMRTSPLLQDTAYYFEVAGPTIEYYIKKRWGMSYMEFRSKHLADTRAVLVNTALEEALVKRNWRAIEKCLEYYCKWHKVLDITNSDGVSNVIKLAYSLDEPEQEQPQIEATPKEVIDVEPA